MVGETRSHDFVDNKEGAEFMCCGVEVLKKVGGTYDDSSTALYGLY